MNNPGGISNSKPIEPGSGAPESPDLSQGDGASALHMPVRTLDELKNVLIKSFGPEAGLKFYNSFMFSFAMIMLQQLQESAQHAKQAAQNARMNVS